MLLTSISLDRESIDDTRYPFSIPVIESLRTLTFTTPVTFLVGENGSGKSTLLEGIAAGSRSIAIGGTDIEHDETLAHARRLGDAIRFSWSKRTHRGFFLRAEDVFNFARRINRMRSELGDLSKGFEEHLNGYGLSLARGSVEAQRRELEARYGADADARSHGETFLNIFEQRLVPNGLYLLDEPEAALSPLRQLTLISMMKEMVEQDAQFIIATHAPILMAFPDARILSFDSYEIQEVAYDDVEHVSLTRAFLKNPEAYLRRL